MADDPNQCPIRILDKEYIVGCAPSEQHELLESARLLDQKMREIRDSGKVIGLERIAVMAALNLAHDAIQNRRDHDESSDEVGKHIERLQQKIDAALERDRQMEI